MRLFLKKILSKNKWFLILTSFLGILIIFFDPKLNENYLGLFFASLMALFFGLAQVYSRQLKELPTSMINASTGIFFFYSSTFFLFLLEGNIYKNIEQINIKFLDFNFLSSNNCIFMCTFINVLSL